MTKNEMIKSVNDRLEGFKQKEIEAVLGAYTETVIDILTKNRDEKIVLPGVGTFSVKHVDERSGVVQLGESKGSTWTKPAHDELVFKIAKSVKKLA